MKHYLIAIALILMLPVAPLSAQETGQEAQKTQKQTPPPDAVSADAALPPGETPKAEAETETDPILDIKVVTSESGLKAWLVEDHSVPVIALKYAFKGAGAKEDPEGKQGTARLLSNTMDEGAGDIQSQDFQKELRDLSISLNFGSTRDDFTGHLKTLTRNKDRAFELLTLALTKPRFDQEPVDRMRAANQSRIRASLSDPDWIAARIQNDVAFEGHPYARNSGGTLSSLDKITPDDLRAFHKDHLGKNNLVIAVTGDITEEELGPVLDRVFGGLPVVEKPEELEQITVQNQGEITLYKKDIPQTLIEIIQPGIDRKDPDYHTAQVMNFILGSSGFGSRLTKEIREKQGLTYGIYSYFIDMDYFDGLAVSTSTRNESAPAMLAAIRGEWNRMKEESVSAEELKTAKSYLTGSLPLSLTSTDKIAALLLSIRMDNLPVDYLDRRETAIKETSIEDIKRVAQKILDTGKMAIVLVGQPEGIEADTIVDTLPNVE